MGLMSFLFGGLRRAGGVGAAAEGIREVAEVFHPNQTRRMELGHDAFRAAHDSHAAEFAHTPRGGFDGFVNGLNRLPRPMLALGTLGLFAFAMADPDAFAVRMRGLAEVPEPLWWLLGAVVSFYFGAREAHYLREGRAPRAPAAPDGASARSPDAAAAPPVPDLIEAAVAAPNPALDEAAVRPRTAA